VPLRPTPPPCLASSLLACGPRVFPRATPRAQTKITRVELCRFADTLVRVPGYTPYFSFHRQSIGEGDVSVRACLDVWFVWRVWKGRGGGVTPGILGVRGGPDPLPDPCVGMCAHGAGYSGVGTYCCSRWLPVRAEEGITGVLVPGPGGRACDRVPPHPPLGDGARGVDAEGDPEDTGGWEEAAGTGGRGPVAFTALRLDSEGRCVVTDHG
jgi:hypothetical protein